MPCLLLLLATIMDMLGSIEAKIDGVQSYLDDAVTTALATLREAMETANQGIQDTQNYLETGVDPKIDHITDQIDSPAYGLEEIKSEIAQQQAQADRMERWVIESHLANPKKAPESVASIWTNPSNLQPRQGGCRSGGDHPGLGVPRLRHQESRQNLGQGQG